jgi:hypothetical protein
VAFFLVAFLRVAFFRVAFLRVVFLRVAMSVLPPHESTVGFHLMGWDAIK